MMEQFNQKFGNVLFVDGITRSGKFWIANAFIHFEKMEHIQHYSIMDNVMHMEQMGVISNNACAGILQNELRTRMFEMMIGRNINFRYSDSSSVYKNPNLHDYLGRVADKNASLMETAKNIFETNRTFLFIVHDWLSNAGTFSDIFPCAKMIRIERHPIDLVYAWHKEQLGSQKAFAGSVESPCGVVPWFAYNYPSEYQKMTEIDRIILAIEFLFDSSVFAYGGLSDEQKGKVLFTTYEDFATNTKVELDKIADFLGVKMMPTINIFLANDIFNIRNKEFILQKRNEKFMEIKNIVSEEIVSRLQRLVEKYEKFIIDIQK